MVIREIRALHPIAAFLQRVANDDIIANGYTIPKRSRRRRAPPSHLDAANFPKPTRSVRNRFDPKRHLPGKHGQPDRIWRRPASLPGGISPGWR